MKHHRYIWLGFALCLAVVLSAMGWITLVAIRLDRAEADARHQEAEAHRRAAWEEKTRLALWRMDSVLSPLVAQESARPYFVYSSFLPVDRAYGRMFNGRAGGEALIPSPLLATDLPSVLLFFQYEPDGQLTSPQVPTGSNYELAVPRHVLEAAVRTGESHLARLASLVDRQRLTAMLPDSAPEPVAMVVSPLDQTADQRAANRLRQAEAQQRSPSVAEFVQRTQAVISNANQAMAQNFDANALNAFNNELFSAPTDVTGVLMTPLWIDDQLILARRVTAGGSEYVQGCLLDWPTIRTSLLEMVEDLLPEANLVPMTGTRSEEEPCVLAALPVRLTATYPTSDANGSEATGIGVFGSASPIRLSLAVAWSCFLLAAVAVAMLLAGVIRLSERRATFVSAVTHELRTPLTTFQMYAEMLAEGMVTDPQQQRQYLQTLHAESSRLTHLVENVLSYARLERGRTAGRLTTIAIGEMTASMAGRLNARAEQAGMELVVEQGGLVDAHLVYANVSAVEQVLFNLVDNACKYAANDSDKRIHLSCEARDGEVRLRLRDHGPGISAEMRRRLFRPFSKSAHEAAHSAPGVGLGLALSRRLARDMRGDLQFEENGTDGACFVLSLASADSDT
ncbi:MAG TPA: HAMP domain-containing sensor histidine kinase [Thermoguttaceae bacterium]|nr:HAMP domain-containing sensor histidine kinase [Thermoguttaceae bacterium]